jgi:hypothetical protein
MKTKTAALWLTVSSILVAGAACSSSSSDGAGGGGTPPKNDGGSQTSNDSGPPGATPDPQVPPTVGAACEATAKALCAKIQTCTEFGLKAIYGDVATCEARNTLSCKEAATATGQVATADQLTECANSISSLTCQQVLSYDSGPKCQFKGTLKDGAPCGYGNQCESTFCAVAKNQVCGTCAEPTKEGDDCVNNACSPGTACGEDDGKCHVPGTGKPGDSCTRFADCDLANQSACNTFSVSKKCIAVELSTDGTCGVDSAVSPSKFTVCPASGNCSSPLGGTCQSIAQDGEDCSSTGPSCVPPARCTEGGKCALPSPTCNK